MFFLGDTVGRNVTVTYSGDPTLSAVGEVVSVSYKEGLLKYFVHWMVGLYSWHTTEELRLISRSEDI